MKMRKSIAAIAAATLLTASIAAVNVGAIDMKYYREDDNNTIFVNANKEEDPNWSADYKADITTVYGAEYTIELDADKLSNGDWFGGAICVNSNSNGWKNVATWGTGEEDIGIEATKKATVKYLATSPIFAADDEYAQICMQSYGAKIKVTKVELLDKDGNPINLELPVEEAPAEEAAEEIAAPAEETAAPVEEAAEETAVEEEAAEETAVEETAAPAVDLSNLDGDVIYGETATSDGAWGQAITLQCVKNEGGVFDPTILTEDKAVVVYYEADTAPEVVLQSWSGGEGWAKVPANEEYSSEGVAVFTYDYMVDMYEADNFEETLDCFIVGDTGSALTVNKVLLVDTAALAAAPAEEEENVEEAVEEVVEETPVEVIEVPEEAEETVAEVVVETVPETPAATETAPAKTGNASSAALAAVMAVAGAAVAASRRK